MQAMTFKTRHYSLALNSVHNMYVMYTPLTKPLRMVKAMAANRSSTRIKSKGRQISFML